MRQRTAIALSFAWVFAGLFLGVYLAKWIGGLGGGTVALVVIGLTFWFFNPVCAWLERRVGP